MPPKYVEWKREVAPILLAQAKGQNIAIPISDPCHIEILLASPSRRGDLDNWCGSVFDALVQSQILIDDNLGVLPELTARWKRGVPQCTVILTPIL